MVREHITVKYTEKDEKGFTFRKLKEHDKEKELKDLRRKRNFKLLWMTILLVLGMIMLGTKLDDTFEIIIYIYEIVVVFVFLVYILNDNTNIKTLKKDNVYEFDVEILELLPVEVVQSWGVDNIITDEIFYSIVGRDIVSQYESVCFISKEIYKKAKCGDSITIQRYIRSKMWR